MPPKKRVSKKKPGAKKRKAPVRRTPTAPPRIVYVDPQTGEGIGDWFRAAKRGVSNLNRKAKSARVVGRTDDFLARTGFRDPVRNLIASNVPHGRRVLQAADFAKQRGYGAQSGGAADITNYQNGEGIVSDLLAGAASLIPGVGPIVSPLVGNLTGKLGLGQTGGASGTYGSIRY